MKPSVAATCGQGFVDLVFAPFMILINKKGFGSPSQTSKFQLGILTFDSTKPCSWVVAAPCTRHVIKPFNPVDGSLCTELWFKTCATIHIMTANRKHPCAAELFPAVWAEWGKFDAVECDVGGGNLGVIGSGVLHWEVDDTLSQGGNLNKFMKSYRVFHQHADLGWVPLNLGCSLIGHFCPNPICLRRIRQIVELPRSKSTQPRSTSWCNTLYY